MENDDLVVKKVDLKVWKKIFNFVFKSKKDLIWMMITVTILAFLDALIPIMNSFALKNYFGENSDYSSLWIFIVLYILISIGYFIVVTLFIFLAGRIEVKTSYLIRKEAFKHLQELPFSYYDQTPTGWIMARMTSDSRRLSEIISWGIVDFLWAVMMMIFIFIMMMISKIELSIIIIVAFPLLMVITIYFRKKMLDAYRNVRKVNSEVTASYNEGFLGAKTTKSLVIEERNIGEFREKTHRLRGHAIKAAVISSFFGPTMFTLAYVAIGTTLVVGGNMVLEGILAGNILYLFIDYTIRFFDPVMNLSRLIGDFQMAQASAERIMTLLETKPEIIDSLEVVKKYGDLFNPIYSNFEELKGDIEFKNVTFKYNKGEEVLKDFNLKIKQGETIALVGHTGSGKTTISNLICRFYEPSEGNILIDGIDYKDRSIGWLHKNIGYVLQSPLLFKGTIFDNVRYGKLDASLDEVKKALEIVNASDFINSLGEKYNFDVGEGGNKLSLGQRQLISFARAIIKDPKILVLDEATSSVDTETEHLIQEAIDKILANRTSIVVAHRLSTIVNADKIILLDNGKIVEMGSHDELIKLKGKYYELYKNQFIKELEEKRQLEI